MHKLIKTNKWIAFLLSMVIIIGILPMSVYAESSENVNILDGENYGVGNPSYENQVATFDCVWFGNYMQSRDGGKTMTPIKWRVLSIEGNKALLLADKNLDNKRFNDWWNWGISWEESTLKEWMNADFKDTAFGEKEKNALCINNSTEGEVFALSKTDIETTNNILRENSFDDEAIKKVWKSTNTDYLNECLEKEGIEAPNTGWWLRSNGMFRFLACHITEDGGIDERNIDEGDERGRTMARPSVYLDLSKTDCWSYAGTVSSDGTVSEPAPQSFDYINDTWNFSNLTSKIPISTYGMFFSPIKSIRLHANNDGTGGQCAGMSLSVASIYEGFPKVSSFGKYSCLNEIEKDIYSDDVKCKAKDFIGYASVYQKTEKYQNMMWKNRNNYDGLYEAINDFHYNDGMPVVIGIGSTGAKIKGAHALLGLEVVSESNEDASILVYDCNYPNEKCYLTLTKSNGVFDGWSYDLLGWNSSQKSGDFSYMPIASEFINDYKVEYAEKGIDNLLMEIQKKANGLLKYGDISELLPNLVNNKLNEITPIVEENGNDTSDSDSYWLDNSKIVEVEKLSKDSKVRLSNDDLSISLLSNQDANISIDMNNKEVAIDSKNNDFDVEYEKLLDYENSRIFSVKGNENEKVNLKNTDDNTWEMSGTNSFLVSYETKVYEEDGTSDVKKEQEVELKNANADSAYQIEVNDESIIIREDKDKDGVFENQVIPADSNNSGNNNDSKSDGTISDSNNSGKNNNSKPGGTITDLNNSKNIDNSKQNTTVSNKKLNNETLESVKTGDYTNITLWLVVLGFSVIIIGTCVYELRIKRRK